MMNIGVSQYRVWDVVRHNGKETLRYIVQMNDTSVWFVDYDGYPSYKVDPWLFNCERAMTPRIHTI